MINLSESGSRQLDSSRTILAENLHAVNSTSIEVIIMCSLCKRDQLSKVNLFSFKLWHGIDHKVVVGK